MAHYTYKFRIYPNNEQQRRLAQHFGCQRFAYNYFLNKRNEEYRSQNISSDYYKDAAELTQLKKELEWLKEPNSQSLQRTLKHLDDAFKRFFKKKAKFPRFKSRKSKQSFTIPQHVKIQGNKVSFPKFKEGIKIRIHRHFEGKIINATVSRRPCGHHYIAILVEKDIGKRPKALNDFVGIDLGVKDLATCSNGELPRR